MTVETDWVKCWKLECSPPLEVYETYINFFGSNIDIDRLDAFIESKERQYLFAKAAKEKWEQEFRKDIAAYEEKGEDRTGR